MTRYVIPEVCANIAYSIASSKRDVFRDASSICTTRVTSVTVMDIPYWCFRLRKWTNVLVDCRPSAPTNLVPPNFPDTVDQQRHNKNHGGDSIARNDALAYPDSTQATKCVRLKQMFNPLIPNTVRSDHHFVWKGARGQKGPDNRNSGNR